MDDQTLHHFMEDLSPIIIGVVLILAASWVVGTIVIAYRDKANLRTRADLFNRLLDKFGSAPEFVSYLQSETGRAFFEEMPIKSNSPVNKILGSIHIGIILTMLGIGLLMLSNFFGSSLGGDLYIVLSVSGTIALTVGIGFLISTGVSYYLSKSLGLLEDTGSKARKTEETSDTF